MRVQLGALVTTNESTSGAVTDVDSCGSVLVRLTDGPALDDMDRSHGRWYDRGEITAVTGYDESVMVWRGARMVPAGPRQEGEGETVRQMLVCSKCGDKRPDGDVESEGVSKGAQCPYIDCDGTYIDTKEA